MDTLKRHLPVNGQDGLHELKKIAIRFEEKIYTAATSQGDYLRKISLKMLTMETKSQNPPAILCRPTLLAIAIRPQTQSVNSSMQATQHSVHMLQQPKVPVQQQPQQSASNLVPNQGAAQSQSQSQSQSQPQPSQQHQQHMISQIQSQSPQLQQQLGLQQQPTSLQRDMQQRLQASGSLLQQQNVIDQQKQLYHRPVPDTSSTSLDSTAQTGHATGGDWQEEIYQKIKAMKEMYLPELNEMYHKIAMKLQQHDSLPQQPKSDPLEKLKMFKNMLERIISFLQISKSNVSPAHKEKLGLYEKQILNFINTNRPRKPVSSLQQGQLPPPHMHSMQQPQSQIPQMQSHENQMNLQAMNLQGSVATMQQNNMTSLQHNSLSTLSGGPTAQQNMMNSLQPGSSLDSGQGNSLSSLQPVAMGSLQQNPSMQEKAAPESYQKGNSINIFFPIFFSGTIVDKNSCP
ncbi:Mediator of RNA polymerase II transcription subunit 15a [Morella rubra]|uniref:Mediator of RNA polymerase II transcription subunit 15a n=1 Tax=Morella rubra TaxID=262757 RepID=A0A6A1W0L0_9ROSI|nr:Mediator of RNA polymerase II transcription subunit 15a [Morella rubra]